MPPHSSSAVYGPDVTAPRNNTKEIKILKNPMQIKGMHFNQVSNGKNNNDDNKLKF